MLLTAQNPNGQTQCVESLAKQATCLTDRCSAHDEDLKGIKATERTLILKVEELQGGSRSYREKLDDIDKQSSCISERVAGLAVLMEAHTKNKEDVAMKVDCLKNEFKRHSESLEGFIFCCGAAWQLCW